MAVETTKTMGIVELEEIVDGVVRQRRIVENALAYEFRNQEASWMAGESYVLPGYVGIGLGTAASTVNQRTVTELVTEVFRSDIATDPAILSNGTRFRSIFRPNDIDADITEMMLFSADALTVEIDDCDVLGSWATGSNQVLSLETTDRKEGVGAIEDTASAGASDPSFTHSSLGNIDVSTANESLQYWFYIDDTTRIGNITLRLGTDSSNYWSWTVLQAGLSNGWNFTEVDFADASTTGTPDDTDVDYFYLATTKSDAVLMRIDYIRTFEANGTGLARVELSPAFSKEIGSILNVTWTILPDYESKINSFLWEADTDNYSYIADVKTELTETGSGAFPAVASHPWTYTAMWQPATDGFMTGGRNALSYTAGSIAVWVRFGAAEAATWAKIWLWYADANNWITLAWNTTNYWRFNYSTGGAGQAEVEIADTPTQNDYAFLVTTWDDTVIGLSVNGVARTTATGTLALPDLSAYEIWWGGGTGQVHWNTGGSQTDGKIGPVLAFNRALSDAEISSLYAIDRKYVYGEQ